MRESITIVRTPILAFLMTLALEAAPAAQQRQPPAKAAWTALEAGRLQDASRLFAEALAASPRDPLLHLGAATVANRLGQLQDAKAAYREALRLAPALTPASLLLGDLMAKEGDLREAIAIYEAAAVHEPAHKQIAERLERWRAELALHDQFRQAIGPNFTVLFEGPSEEKLAARALALLEASYWRIGTTFGVYPVGVVTLILYTQQQFEDITQSPSWSAGVFDGKIRLPVRGALNDEREFQRVLAHEYTHALIYSIAPRRVPQWLNEGLATVFEREDMSWSRAQVAKADTLLPPEKLMTSFRGLPASQVKLAYAVSGLAAKALLDLASPANVVALLQDLAAGADFEEAFLRRALVPFDEFARTAFSKP
jgi:tetratricopeptide (TPR) repeat protein